MSVTAWRDLLVHRRRRLGVVAAEANDVAVIHGRKGGQGLGSAWVREGRSMSLEAGPASTQRRVVSEV
jgi:hypothetical protein